MKIDSKTGKVVENINFGVNLLGLGATETSLIGDYTNHALLMYDVAKGEITQTINLADFVCRRGKRLCQADGRIVQNDHC